jgi:NAD(P)-dependent dehydrogenase (short-subunit alcohol dehydrogenase family)
VLLHYGTGERETAAVLAEIRQAVGKGDLVAADLRAADGPHLLAERTRLVIGGRLDIVVANAGIARSASLEQTTVEDFDAIFAVNVRVPYFLIQQLQRADR